MFKNSFQCKYAALLAIVCFAKTPCMASDTTHVLVRAAGFLSILYSIGSKPLQIWDKQGKWEGCKGCPFVL